MLQVFHRHVASVCSKCFVCFRRMLQAFLSGCCICFIHMLQAYILNVSIVSFLGCSTFFQVAVRFFMLQVFYLNVAYVLHIYCKCMFRMFHLLHTYVALTCFYVANVLCFRGTFRESPKCLRMARA